MKRRQISLVLISVELIALLCALLQNVVANDIWNWMNTRTWYSPAEGALGLGVLFTLNILLLARGFWQRVLATGLALGMLLAICLLIALPRQTQRGVAGQWLQDDYVRVLIPKTTSGTLLSEENYDLELSVENRTSMALEVTKIEVEKYNHEAAQALGRDGDLIHTGTLNALELIKANDRKTFSIPGNNVLPKTAIVKIYHTLSGEPSIFQVAIGGEPMSMPPPRQLPSQAIYTGIDGLGPVATAFRAARAWDQKALLLAAYPGDNQIFIDPGTRLKFVVAKGWVVTFYSSNRDRVYTAIIRGNNVEGSDSPRSLSLSDIPNQSADLPKIGNQQALEIASRQNLLCDDMKYGPVLRVIDVEGLWKAVWILAYRSSDSLPVIIDAQDGSLVRKHGVEIAVRTDQTLTHEQQRSSQ